MSTDLSRLASPFAPDRVSWRVGSTTERDGKTKGMALAYVDARDIMDRLDEVVGPSNWQDKYRREHETTICSLSLRVDGEWITKEDGSGDTDVEAEKGALSKALVRAAVKWRIGRYLYDLKSPWVECEKRGRSTVIKESEYAKLEAILRRAPSPQSPMLVTSGSGPTETDRAKAAGWISDIGECVSRADLSALFRTPEWEAAKADMTPEAQKLVQDALARHPNYQQRVAA